MSRKSHGLILSYRQKKWKMSVLVKFEVFTKMSSLSPLLAIPMLQIVIKHLKMIFICMFSERSTFSLLASGRLLLLLTTSCRSIVAKHSIQYSYRILHDMSPNQWNIIFKPMLMKTKRSRWLTFAKCVHKTRLSAISLIKNIIEKYVLVRFTQS